MARRTDARRRSLDAAGAIAPRALLIGSVIAALFAGRPAAAQEPIITGINLDRLQLVSLGVSVGRILPSQVEPTMIYGGWADYGELAKDWRVVFGVTYWDSRYRDAVVLTFVDSLRRSLDNPNTRVVASRVNLYDVAFSGEARYVPNYSGELKPYLGLGFAAHVINAEGKLINGTFVERSLDNIAAGVFMTAGVSIRLLRHFGIEGGARADLLSGFRSTQIRGGAAYYFGRIRGTRIAPADTTRGPGTR